MKNVLNLFGSIIGSAGALLAVFAILARFAGYYIVLGSEARTWLMVGIALMVMGCLAKLHVLTLEATTR
jgi:hypothetical protein